MKNTVNRHSTRMRPPVVLVYHGTPPGRSADPYSLHAERFRRHIDHLADNGWRTLTMRELLSGNGNRERCVAITFDDGYDDNYEHAFRLLESRGMMATWFIVASGMGGRSDWLTGRQAERSLMSRERVCELESAGMEIGSHGWRHVPFPSLSSRQQLEEMIRSKHELEDLLGRPVEGFAFPFGQYTAESLGLLERAGYRYGCTTRSGRFNPAESPYEIRRITIFSGDDEKILARKLAFADNDVSWKKMTRYYLGRLWGRVKALSP